MADDLTFALAATADSARRAALPTAYYDGDQRLMFATDVFRDTFGQMFEAFADNLCAPVVDAIADRLAIEGWSGANGEQAEQLWIENFGTRISGEAHLEALTAGNSAVIVWPGPDMRPVFWPQLAGTIAIEYDAAVPGRVSFAAKVWRETGRSDYAGRWRMTLYYPDRIERFITKTRLNERPSTAAPFVPFDADDAGPVVVNQWDVVPVFPLANNAAVGRPGKSELKDALPIQDALNKSVADMLIAMEFAAVPQRYGIGILDQRDPTTGEKVEPLKAGINRLWTVANGNAQLGQFDAADLNAFLSVSTSFRAEMARVTGTPLHYFQLQSGDAPSGKALDKLDERNIKKVEDRQDSFTSSCWKPAMELGLIMSGIRQPDATPRWASAETRDESGDLDNAAKKKDLGVPADVYLVELGYSADEVAGWMQNRTQDVADLGAAMLASFDRGGPAPVDGAADLKAKADALGVLIRAGVDPADAATRVGLPGVEFTGAVPTSLRLPEGDAANLETA